MAEFETARQGQNFTDTAEFLQFVTEEAEIAAEEKLLQDYERSVETNAAQLRQAEEDAAGKSRIDLELLRAEVEEQESAAGEVNAGLTEVRYRIRNNEDKCGRISGLWPEFESAGRLGAVCTRLYRLVRGNTGNGKITLEQYVQAAGKKVYLLDLVGTKPDELPVSLKNYLSIVASTKRNGVEIQKS